MQLGDARLMRVEHYLGLGFEPTVMPTYFAEPHCCRIVGQGGKFGIKWY